MGGEVSAVTADAVTGSHRHNRGCGACIVSGRDTQQESVGSIMTGGAGVMDLVVASAHRHTGGSAGSIRMAARAFRGRGHPGVMRHVDVGDCTVAVYTGSTHHGNDRSFGGRIIRGTQGEEPSIVSMTGGADIMHLVIDSA